ncbi:nucleotidyltransferase family protein [Hippea jasoniae]|uniref:nucleotidyltransferase family protein n=1 Tax=Hippea jasoniae TaxID=944479 RepID=UPI000555DEF9|nr:nucleotidyltransferase domain-containing protein [Hippea jasoniae]
MKNIKEAKLNLSIELINQLVDIIISEVDVEKIAIFGSMARGDFTQSSDIDVALFGVDRGNVMLVRDRLNEKLNTLRDVDLVVFEELKNDALKSKILKEGVVVYERNSK